jgi:hypothetical protein
MADKIAVFVSYHHSDEMGLTERTGSTRNSRPIRPFVRCLRQRVGYLEQGAECPQKHRLPQYLPQ